MMNAIANTVIEKLECIEQQLMALQRMLGYEYGRPVRDQLGHDPRTLPSIHRVTLPGNTSIEVDVTAELGKPATRGHITNIGNNAATVVFVVTSPRAEHSQNSGPYVLMPGTTLDVSFFVERLRVTAGANPVDVQVYVQ